MTLSDPIFTTLDPDQRKAVLHDGGPLLLVAGAGSIGIRVHHLPLGRETVFGPKAFEMNERRLPETVDGVLQGGERDRFALRVLHDLRTARSARPLRATPRGRWRWCNR